MTTDIDLRFPMTPEEYQVVRERFAEAGVEVPDGYQGVITMSGVSASFTYGAEELKIHVFQKPFLAPDSMVVSKLTDFIKDQ